MQNPAPTSPGLLDVLSIDSRGAVGPLRDPRARTLALCRASAAPPRMSALLTILLVVLVVLFLLGGFGYSRRGRRSV
jgi:hypothetical protein